MHVYLIVNFSMNIIVDVYFSLLIKTHPSTAYLSVLLIHFWKPQLNAPWIVRLNPTSTTRFAQPFTVKSCYGSPGKSFALKFVVNFVPWGYFDCMRTPCLSPKTTGYC